MARDPRLHWPDHDWEFPPFELADGVAPHPARIHLYARVANPTGTGTRWRLRPEFQSRRVPRVEVPARRVGGPPQPATEPAAEGFVVRPGEPEIFRPPVPPGRVEPGKP